MKSGEFIRAMIVGGIGVLAIFLIVSATVLARGISVLL